MQDWEHRAVSARLIARNLDIYVTSPEFLKFLFIYFYFWLRWVFIAARRLSLAAASGGYTSLWCAGFSLWWLLLLQSTGSRHVGFSSCGAQASVAVARGLSSCGART